jgi:hypothetical protein
VCVDCKHRREHVTDVDEGTLAEHRRAIRELADRMRQILRGLAHEIHEHVSDDSAVLGVTLCEWPDLLEVYLLR